jgi:hypothetical protein
MFYHAFAGIPEWAPPHENHILYSEGILRNVYYAKDEVGYQATSNHGTEYLRLSFNPGKVTLDGKNISMSRELKPDTYMYKDLGNGDCALTIRHKASCKVVISAERMKNEQL